LTKEGEIGLPISKEKNYPQRGGKKNALLPDVVSTVPTESKEIGELGKKKTLVLKKKKPNPLDKEEKSVTEQWH